LPHEDERDLIDDRRRFDRASIDAGIDQAFLNGALFLQLTIFRQDLRNEINGFAFDPGTFLATAENMDGRSSRQGLELEATFKPIERLEFGGSYTYTDASEENSLGQDVRELGRPLHSGSLHSTFRFHDDRGSVLLFGTYGGTQDDVFFPPFPAAPENVTLGNYWLLGLTTAYDISREFNVFVRVTNLLDEDYEEIYGYRTPGRAAFLGVRMHFGR
jgi:vitamin B12 transporter